MLSIFLMILKVIGIILLVIVGLVLTILLALLFVSLKYKGQGSYFEKPAGVIKLSWLFHIISLTISYQEEVEVAIRLFGFRILKEKEEVEEDTPDFFEEPMVSIQEVGTSIADPKEELRTEALQKEKPSAAQIPLTDVPKKGFFRRIMDRIKKLINRLTRAFKAFLANLKKADDLKQKVMTAITDEENKKTFHLITGQAKKLIRHILPKKIKGHITFGFDDPYTTGQVLTGAALFYPVYRDNFTLQPVFDQQIIEGEVTFKGRIRLCVFIAAGLKIFLNKNFRVQLKKIMNRGGMRDGR